MKCMRCGLFLVREMGWPAWSCGCGARVLVRVTDGEARMKYKSREVDGPESKYWTEVPEGSLWVVDL